MKKSIQTKMKLKKYKIYKNFLSQARGLMFSKRKTIVFAFKEEQEVPLHMWFVFFPIDALYLDKNKKIIEVKKNFKPFNFYTPKKHAKYVIEIPLPHKYKYRIGQKVQFKA